MFYLIAIVIVAGFLVLGCAQAMIENTIDDFEAAVNDENGVEDLMDVLSEDSDFMAGEPITVEYFHAYFDGFRPINYHSLDVQVDGGYADVYTTADYTGDPNPLEVMFEMRRHGFFLFPTWKVKQYWDDNGGSLSVVWQRLKAIKLLEQDE
jgi:hypothetical protein